MSLAPPFITHHELEAFLGGGAGGKRRRQRLQERELLPEAFWLPRIDRVRVAVYPTFALAGLVDALTGAPRAKERLRKLGQRVFSAAVFEEVSEAMNASVRDVVGQGTGRWRFDVITQRMTDLAEPALLEWDAVVQEAVEELSRWGVTISHELGSVERRSEGVYVVSLGNGRLERFSPARVVAELHKGSAVAVEHIRVMGDGLDVVTPALQTRETHAPGNAAELDWSEVTEKVWDEVVQAAASRASDCPFANDYWEDDGTRTADARFHVPPDALSGRKAAANLLATRANS